MADDVEARVRVAEEELNLLKNQVQQTLLDVREHILDLVEPGSAIPRGDRPADSKDDEAGPVGAVALPPTETGGGMPQGGGMGSMPGLDMGGGGGLGDMPGLDMDGGGLGDMPGMDMGDDPGFGDMPDMTLGDDDGFGDMPGLDMGDDAGFGDMPGMDMGGDVGVDDAGNGGGFDMEEAPFVETSTASSVSPGGGFADAPFDDPGAGGGDGYQDQGGYPPQGGGYQDQGGYSPQGGYQDQGGYVDQGAYAADDGYEYAEDSEPIAEVVEDVAETAPEAAPAEAQAPAEESTPLAPPPAALDNAVAEMDLVTLVSVVRWVDQAVQRLGQRRVDALLDVWHMTGRISEPTRDMIQKLCSLTHEDEDERVPLRELVAMMIQMEAVLDTEESTNSRLLAMLFEGPGDPLSGLEALAS